MTTAIEFNTDKNLGSIHFDDLTAGEFDNLRVLLKSIVDYGQFVEPSIISKSLAFDNVIKQIVGEAKARGEV